MNRLPRATSTTREMRQLFEPAPEEARRWYWAPIAVLILGLLSIAMLAWALWDVDRRTAENLAAARAITDLQSAVAYWHLWLEEHLTKDPYIDLDRDVRGNQDLAMRLASMLLRGGRRDNGDIVSPLEAPELRDEAEALEAALTEFRNISEKRLASPEEAGVGTPLDQDFDAIFQQVKLHAEELRRLEEEFLDRDRANYRLRIFFSVGVWSLIVAAAAAGLWSRERRRQQTADTLRASQRWLATTLSSIGDAVITTDLEGRIFFMNPEAERLTAWQRAEASGRPISQVFDIVREDGQPIEDPVAQVLRTGESVGMSNHTVILNRDRQDCYAIDEGAAPIRDDRDELLGVVLVFRDVSTRRQTEKALRQREAELRQAQKMEAVGRLAGGIAHDVNNYLGAIRGYCEVAVLKGESGAALAQRMNAAVETADKVSTLIRQLLAFSRRQPVQPEVVDLNRVITNLEELMKRLLGEDVALETRLDDQLWAIEIDPSQIEQTLVNLLVNARDAMPQGGRIVIETGHVELDQAFLEPHPTTRPGRFARLAVSDTGSGIPAEARDKIFDPFFTTKAESGSSGLGLATVYAIVHQCGGVIDLDSVVGKGTRFEIYLPASDAAPVARDEARAEPLTRTGPARILLVEDNEDMRSSTLALLETLGHEVRVAADGEQALEILDGGESIDLLITDVIMPGISGKELYDRIVEKGIDVRCLFISGYTDNVMLRHGLSQDRVHFLQKPFSFDGLARKIGEVLEGRTG